MKIGIIYTAFNTAEYLDASIAPWLEARKNQLNGNHFCVCAVSLPFKDFPSERLDKTKQKLEALYDLDEIDDLIVGPDSIPETEARTLALKKLLGRQVDIVMQVDGDEFFTTEQIGGIFEFVAKNRFISWFRLSYKNYVFNEKTFLNEAFTPPRIYRTPYLDRFYDDNNLQYKMSDGRVVKDLEMASLTIPKNVAWVKHLTWLSDERSKKKCEYQQKRWGACSFRWDDEKNELCFDEKYFSSRGLLPPEISTENP